MPRRVSAWSKFWQTPVGVREVVTRSRRRSHAARNKRMGYLTSWQRGRYQRAGYYGRFRGRGAELKFIDQAMAPTTIPSTGVTVQNLLIIPQGVGESERVGRNVTVRSVHGRLRINLPGQLNLVTPQTEHVRIILYCNRQTNGVTIAHTDLLETASFLSYLNLANSHRFKVLWTQRLSLSPSAASGDGSASADWGPRTVYRTFNVKVNLPVEYDGTTGANPEIKSNGIGILFISSSGIATVDGEFRARFSDK